MKFGRGKLFFNPESKHRQRWDDFRWWWRQWWDLLGTLAVCIVLVAVMFAGIIALVNWQGARACLHYAERTGFLTDWAPMDECYVERDGRWWRWDEYVAAYTASEKREE
jgi:hypothetical protein